MAGEYSKSTKRKLRELAGVAYERELSKHLESLLGEFKRWQDGKIDCFELNDLVHKFHHGPSRELFSFYTNPQLSFAVVRAITENLLNESEIPKEIMAELIPLKNRIEEFKKSETK